MKLVYYTNKYSHLGWIAGAIHLNQLPADSIPEIDQLAKVFVKARSAGIRFLTDLGRDEYGNEIYTLHFGGVPDFGLQTVSFWLAENSNSLDWKFFNVPMDTNFFTGIHSFILRHLQLEKLEQQMAVHRILKNYRKIAALVKQVKELGKIHG